MADIFNIPTLIKLFIQDLFKTTKNQKEDFFISSCSILFTVTILIFVNLLIHIIFPDNSEAIRIEGEKVIATGFHYLIWPEPIENLRVYTSLILAPPLIICSIKIFTSKLFRKISIANYMYFFNLALCFSLLGTLFYFAFKIDGSNFIHQENNILLNQEIRIYFKIITSELRFIAALVIYPLITYFIINGIPKKYTKSVNIILYLFVGIILLSLFFLTIHNRDSYIGVSDHLNAVLYSISQVQQGKYLLVDFSNQYGLYPHFLYPIFKLINVNVTSFSLTMSALTTISYSLIFLSLRKIINNNLVTFLTFIAIIYFSFFGFFNGLLGNICQSCADVYYAYKPIRMIFPALILYSVFTYILNPKKTLYLLIIFISSLSILWNPDSGIICFLSFYIYILYEKLIGNNVRSFTKELFKHTFISLTILAFTFFLASILIYFQSNSFPDWSLFLQMPLLYGKFYFFSLPMPVFNAWNLIFLVYLYGIYVGFSFILSGKRDAIDKIAFFVAIFGLGISTYYFNRSHDLNLIQTLYPSFILLAIFLSKLLDKSNRANLFQIKNFSIVMMISFILVVSLFQTLRPNAIINTLSTRIPDIINNKLINQSISTGVAIVKFNSNPNDEVVILADNDAVIYFETKTSSPFSNPGYSLNATKDQWNKLLDSLADNKLHKVFISGDVYKTGNIPDSRRVDIMKIIDDHYYLDDWVSEWRMFKPIKYKPITKSIISTKVTYSVFCSNNSKNCNSNVKHFHRIDNFPINTKYIKIDLDLSEPITVQSLMLHVIIDSKYNGTMTTLPIDGLRNIGILDNKNKQLINTEQRSDNLNYIVNKKFSILIPENNYLEACPAFKIELAYNNNNKINVRVPCKEKEPK